MTERLVFLDTETTGIAVADGHRIVEIGGIELTGRRRTSNDFFQRVNPGRSIDPEATGVHGIRDADVASEPPFSGIVDRFMAYVRGATLVIHNAEFDLAFLNVELELSGHSIRMDELCRVIDTLRMARRLHPGQRNSLDALCRRYGIDDSSRADAHGALIDAGLLAEVYLAMTAGQSNMDFESERRGASKQSTFLVQLGQSADRPLPVIEASPEEIAMHESRMRTVHQAHLKALAQKVEELRGGTKALADRIHEFESKAESATPAELEAVRKQRDELSGKQRELAATEEKLANARNEGPRLF